MGLLAADQRRWCARCGTPSWMSLLCFSRSCKLMHARCNQPAPRSMSDSTDAENLKYQDLRNGDERAWDHGHISCCRSIRLTRSAAEDLRWLFTADRVHHKTSGCLTSFRRMIPGIVETVLMMMSRTRYAVYRRDGVSLKCGPILRNGRPVNLGASIYPLLGYQTECATSCQEKHDG